MSVLSLVVRVPRRSLLGCCGLARADSASTRRGACWGCLQPPETPSYKWHAGAGRSTRAALVSGQSWARRRPRTAGTDPRSILGTYCLNRRPLRSRRSVGSDMCDPDVECHSHSWHFCRSPSAPHGFGLSGRTVAVYSMPSLAVVARWLSHDCLGHRHRILGMVGGTDYCGAVTGEELRAMPWRGGQMLPPGGYNAPHKPTKGCKASAMHIGGAEQLR